MTALRLEKLAHSYKSHPSRPEDYALKEINQVWQTGGAYALLGPSGCGKTTLLNILSGLVIPSQGRVYFDDRDVTELPTEKRNIAQVFQFPVIYDTMTVRENLAFPLKNRGMDPAGIKTRVDEIAALLDLSRDLDRRAKGLTADAKQKISLGRGLVRPDVTAVLFDEPLTVIDPQLKWELRSKLKEIHRKLAVTMIYVTHDQTEALTFADKVIVMSEGEVVQIGTPEELFEKPLHRFVGHFIGSPGMNFLPCTLAGTKARIGGFEIDLGVSFAADPKAKLELGIRPDFIKLAPPGVGLPVRIDRIDDLGRNRIAHVRLEGQRLAVTVPAILETGSDDLTVVFDHRRIGIFANDRRIEPDDRGGA